MDTQVYSVTTSQGAICVWDTKGSGKPVLFLHGNSACKEVWSRQFDTDFAAKYRFIAIDLIGHGNRDKAKSPNDAYTIPGHADVVVEVMQALELKNPVIVGWSLGGHVGLSLLQKVEKLAGLLIVGTPAINISKEGFEEGFHPLPVFNTLFSQVTFTREEATTFMKESGIDVDQHPFIVEAALKCDGMARQRLAASLQEGVGGNQREIAETTETTICVIQGDEDKGINNEYVLGVGYKKLFRERVYLIDGSGHAAFWEKSEEFNKILLVFLEDMHRVKAQEMIV